MCIWKSTHLAKFQEGIPARTDWQVPSPLTAGLCPPTVPGSGFLSLYLVFTCVWHRPVVGCVYELSVQWHNGVWVFDNIFVGYPDRDPQSLRPACSRGDSGLGCCMAPLEESDS